MPAINLKPIKKFVEDQMTDTITIVADPEGTTDNVWNDDTGTYGPAPGDTNMIYSGKGFVVPLNVFPSQDVEGGATTLSTDFEVHIPLESPAVPVDSVVTVNASMRNPNLVNKEFVVRASQENSFSVDQSLRVYIKEERILQ